MTSSPGLPRIGHYALVRELARGGMGVVYEGYDQRLDRPVAIKVMLADERDTEAVARFLREARAVANLQHPHIVRVYDVGRLQGHHYMVMDLVQGESLQRLLEREGPLEERRAARLIGAVARALAFAHEHGILHRDVKPHNVLLTREGEPKLTDFGIAKVGHQRDPTKPAYDPTQHVEVPLAVAPQLTQEGQLLGTPAFMSPEQADGDRVDARTDVYSLGATLYAILTGRPPFYDENVMNLLFQVLGQEPPEPTSLRPDLDPELEAICLQAMAKDPDERYPSAVAFAEALEAYAEEEEVVSPTASAARRRAPVRSGRSGRTRVAPAKSGVPPAAIFAVAVPALVLGGLLFLRGSSKPDPAPTTATGPEVDVAVASAAPAQPTESPTRDVRPDPAPDPSPSPEPSPSPKPEPSDPPDLPKIPEAPATPTPAPTRVDDAKRSVQEVVVEAAQMAEAGRLEEAWDRLDALGKRAPGSVKRAQLMVRIGFNAGKDAQTLKAVLDRAIKERPRRALLYIDRGLVWRAMNRVDNAAKDFERALKLRPKNDVFAFLCFDAALKTKQFDRVLELISGMIDRNPPGEIFVEYSDLGGVQRQRLQLRLHRAKLRLALKKPGARGDLEAALQQMPPTHPFRPEAKELLARVKAAGIDADPPKKAAKKKKKKKRRGKRKKKKKLRKGIKPHGPVHGRKLGKPFQDFPPRAKVTALRIRFGAWIDGLQLVWGRGKVKEWHGGKGGKAWQIELEPGEVILAIHGRYGDWVNNITLRTDRRVIGPIGAAGGEHAFKLEAPKGYEVCGLRGRASDFLVGLGILVRKR